MIVLQDGVRVYQNGSRSDQEVFVSYAIPGEPQPTLRRSTLPSLI